MFCSTTITPVRFLIQIPDRDDARGGKVAGWRWPNDGAPPLLFCHANGFCASTYKQLCQNLSEQFDVFAIDLRGHGKTELDAAPERDMSWSTYTADVNASLDQIKADFEIAEDWVISGHSLGAAVAIQTAAKRHDVRSLAVIEPLVFSKLVSFASATPLWSVFASQIPLARNARARRAKWKTRKRVLVGYSRKVTFANWAPGVLENYLEDGLIDEEDGVALACSPSWEAANYAASHCGFWRTVRRVKAPMSVYCVTHRSGTVFSGARSGLKRLSSAVVVDDELTHLAPMENPTKLAEFICSAARTK